MWPKKWFNFVPGHWRVLLGFVNCKQNFGLKLKNKILQFIFLLSDNNNYSSNNKKPDILSRHLRALNEAGENSLDYDSAENISTIETEIISHSRILALQLPEITKDLSYGGKLELFFKSQI